MNENHFKYSKHHPNVKDITGKKFGKLQVIRSAGANHRRIMEWWCVCDCGIGYRVQGSSLRKGLTKQCILCAWQSIRDAQSEHGATESTEYNSWRAMISRTTYTKVWNYNRYGGAGISACMGFRSASWFLKCMGPKPTNRHSLDRIENSKGYYCGECEECKRLGRTLNCRWANPKQQARNQSKNRYLEFGGKRLCVSEWSEITGISPSCIFARIGMGWTPEQILTTPVKGAIKRMQRVLAALPPAPESLSCPPQ